MNWILFYLKRNFYSGQFFSCTTSVADPDLQIRGGGWTSRPWDKGWGAVSKENFFQPFGPQFSLKIRWGGRAPRPLPRIHYCTYLSLKHPQGPFHFYQHSHTLPPPCHPRLCQVKKIKEKKLYVFISSYISGGKRYPHMVPANACRPFWPVMFHFLWSKSRHTVLNSLN